MRVVKDTPLSLAWITFPIRPPTTTLIVIAKATFDLGAAEVCPLSEEQRLVTGDAFWDDDVARSVRYDSDLAVAKPQAEWWVTGVWRPSTQRAVTHAVLDVAVGRQRKRLALIGDRWWKKGVMGGATEPRPLIEVPMSYDRAFGGPRHAANPYGLGIAPDPDDPEGRVRLPNIEDPEHLLGSATDRPAVAGSFPTSRMHPARMALTGTYGRRYMETRWPYYPDDFRWAHFQAAPPDQRVDGFFRGDERIEAQGLHPEVLDVRARLPGIAPRVFLHPAGGAAGAPLTQVAMVLDTIVIDATDAKVMAVWRGHVDGVQGSLEDVSHVFAVHEPYDRIGTAERYRAWFDRKLAEEDAEDAAFEPEAPPAASDRAPEAGAPAEPVEAVEPEDEAPLDPLAARRATLLEEGLPLDVVDVLAPAGPPAVADPVEEAAREARELTDAVAALRSMGQDELADALDATRDVEEDEEPPPSEPPPEAPAPATTRQAVERALADGRPLAGALLPGVDLSGLDFSERDMSGCVLVRCDLRGCRFVGANLDGAVLDDSVVDDAVFRGASLRGAHLDRISGERTSFRGAVLEDARAENARFHRADFRDVTASRLELPGCFLAGADFDRAVLDGAELSGSNLAKARFVDASLVDAWLDDGAVAEGAIFEGADLTKLRASESDLRDASFKWAKADGARFGRSKLDRATFSFADLAGADFADASCIQTVLLAVQAPEAVFDRAVLVGAQLGRANLREASFMEADMHHADLRGANLFRAELYLARTEDVLFELANLRGTKLESR